MDVGGGWNGRMDPGFLRNFDTHPLGLEKNDNFWIPHEMFF